MADGPVADRAAMRAARSIPADHPALRIARAAFGVLALTAVLYELTVAARLTGAPVIRYLSFFTTEANIVAGSVLLLGALRPAETRRRDGLRGASVLFILITGIVYLIITVTTNESLGIAAPWANASFHVITPLVVLIDWLAVPPARSIPRRRARRWLRFPIAYFVYSMVRGYFAAWYPYAFVDPSKTGGYSGVLLTGAGMLFVMALLAWAVAAAGDLRRPANAAASASTME